MRNKDARDMIRRGHGRRGCSVRADHLSSRQILNLDSDTMLDLKKALPTYKALGAWSGSLSVNYRAIYRACDKFVNRKFDEFHSYVCSIADSRTELGRQLRDSLTWAIENDCNPCRVDEDGDLLDSKGKLAVYYGKSFAFYVDEEGYLRKWVATPEVIENRKASSWYEEKLTQFDTESRKLGSNLFLVNVKGIWYEVTTRSFEGIKDRAAQAKSVMFCASSDILFGDKFGPYTLHGGSWLLFDVIKRVYCGELHIASSKRSAPRHLLKKYGLTNDPSRGIEVCPVCRAVKCTQHWKTVSKSDKNREGISLTELLKVANVH